MKAMAEQHQQDQRVHPAAALLSKQGLVVTGLARALLACAPGDRIKGVQDYAVEQAASVGTVQAALSYLQTTGAAQLEARGRLGTFVTALNYPLLWSIGLGRPIIGALPLPYSRRLAGLATAMRLQLGQPPLYLDLRFLRGATQRLQALATRACDWAVMSRFVAETASAHGFAIDIVANLGPQSYMGRHALLLAEQSPPEIRDGMRVGIDLQSTDHTFVLRALSRGARVRFVELEYSQALKLLRDGVIDATVWSEEDVPSEIKGIVAAPLDETLILPHLNEAAIVVNQGDVSTANLLRTLLDAEAVRSVQEDVVHMARLPAY